MITDEDHPEFAAVRHALFEQAAILAANNPFTLRTIQMLQQLCDDATAKARTRGIAFPDCIVAYFRGHNLIRIWDREATHQKRQQYLVQLVREVPGLHPREIAAAFRRAWPDYRPEIEEKLASLKGPLTFPGENLQ